MARMIGIDWNDCITHEGDYADVNLNLTSAKTTKPNNNMYCMIFLEAKKNIIFLIYSKTLIKPNL